MTVVDALTHPEQQHRLIEAAYAAVTETGGWQRFIDALSLSCEGAASFYLIPAESPTTTVVTLHSGYDADFLRRYAEEHGAGNVLVDNLHRAPGAIAVCRDLCSRQELMASPLYGDWMRPQHFESAASLHLLEDNGSLLNISMMRRGRHLFDAPHRQALQLLLPHVRRAAGIALRLQRLSTEQQWQEAVLQNLQLALCVLDPQGRILTLNEAATQLLGAGRGLLSSMGRLCLANASDQARLEQALALASGLLGPRQAQTLTTRSALGLNLRLTLCPMPDTQEAFGRLGHQVLLIIGDPGATPPLNEPALREAFDLSAAEARLAVQLCAGLSVEQAATAHGVRVSTVRSQLHSLLLKTGTQRQADLVRLLMGAVGLRLR